jgi:glycosyltransferase involved in cell wall biosynthesis
MTLIDALHINNSGGLVLLDYLIKSIEKYNFKVLYLLDNRLIDNYSFVKSNKIIFLKANLKNRYLFYIKNKNHFKKVFCFGNIPPPIKLSSTCYTYFHQKLFLSFPRNLPIKNKMLLILKSNFIKFLSKNTDYWIVQTNLMRLDFLKKFDNNESEKVLICPFYPPLINDSELIVKRGKSIFLYVSTYNPHKNYENLLDGFKIFYDRFSEGELHLTLDEKSGLILDKIDVMKSKGYPIFNHGFVERKELALLYKASEFLIYPSFSESFGLGIIEGIENGCKIIGADLQYLKSICNPSLTFNPDSPFSIADAFQKSVKNEIKETKQLVFNEIKKLMHLIK